MPEHTVRLTPAPVPDPLTVETGDTVIFDNTAGTSVENASSNDGVTFTTGRIHPGSTSMPIRFDAVSPGVPYTTTSGQTGTVIVTRGAVRFFETIKPYFTPFDRNSMMDPAHTFGLITFDLWSPADCEMHWNAILEAISDGSMPPDEPGSDGPWPPAKVAQFVDDFNRWKDGGFQR